MVGIIAKLPSSQSFLIGSIFAPSPKANTSRWANIGSPAIRLRLSSTLNRDRSSRAISVESSGASSDASMLMPVLSTLLIELLLGK